LIASAGDPSIVEADDVEYSARTATGLPSAFDEPVYDLQVLGVLSGCSQLSNPMAQVGRRKESILAAYLAPFEEAEHLQIE
jgi:hypothetical protein